MPPSTRQFPIPLLLAAALLVGTKAGAEEENAPAPPPKPPEGSVIIDLPSANVNPDGSLQFLINHRFSEPVQDSDIHSVYSFFSPANVGLGLSYVPLHNLETGFLRGQELEDYEVFAKYSVYAPAGGTFAAGVRVGGDFRTARNLEHRDSFFAQGILALTIASRVRISAVPTFSSWAVGQVPPANQNVFNVLGALSIALTSSINLHGEIVPRAHGSPGTGWIASIEKTLLRHRFSFTVGNLRGTTVDQYVLWQPQFSTPQPSNVYFGFNIVRLWKLK